MTGSISILEKEITFSQLTFIAEVLSPQYEYTLDVVKVLLEGYFDGVGDTEQRMDLVAGLKKLPKNGASVLLADAWGWQTGETARRLQVTTRTVQRWRNKGLRQLVDYMNGEKG